MKLWQLGATELARFIARKEVSCTEVVSSCLERMDAVNPIINAVVDQDRARALRDAAAADVALARNEACGPLHGIPVTIKVNVDQEGHATTNGVFAFRDHMAHQDSAVVANLRKAGAIPIGRTNTPAFSMRWFTDNRLHGRTYNPYGRHLTPGGSSGGAAAAVAAGIGPIAHGNDQGGSIRYPAYACGVYGLRPSSGRIPAFNPSAQGERPPTIQASSVQGPLTRNVADLRLALDAMATADIRDPSYVQKPMAYSRGAHAVALCINVPGYKADPEVERSMRQAASYLINAGYHIEEVAPPKFQEVADLWLTLTLNETHVMLERAMLAGGDDALVVAYKGMLDNSPMLNLEQYMQAQAKRITLQREWAVFLDRYPLLLLPTSWKCPFPVDLDQTDSEGMRSIMDAQSPLLSTAILSLPGLAVPLAPVNDIPTGVQLVAGRFQEHLCMDAAEVMESQLEPVRPVSPVSVGFSDPRSRVTTVTGA